MKFPRLVGLLPLLAAPLIPHSAHAGTPTCGKPTEAGAVACNIDTTLDPEALCNDGTIPAFSYRPGSGSGVNTWIIWLGGGGFCDSQASCAVRVTKPGTSKLLSSDGFRAQPGKGVTSNDPTVNPALYNANTVYAEYCSSDTWSGNKVAVGAFNVNDSTTWNFQGRRNIIATIKSVAEIVPALASATVIVLGGDSSGGVGVVEDFNDITPLLPSSASKLLVTDAGFALDIGEYDLQAGSPYVYEGHPNVFESDIVQRLGYWNGRGDAVCDATAKTQEQHAACYVTPYVLQHNYIKAPSFVAISQLDTSQVTQELCPTAYGYCPPSKVPFTPEGVYETSFAKAMASQVVASGTNAAYTAFSPDQYGHVLLNDTATFTTATPFPEGSLAPRDVFDAWLLNPTAPRATYVATGPGVP